VKTGSNLAEGYGPKKGCFLNDDDKIKRNI
jgi:hypothetical protein